MKVYFFLSTKRLNRKGVAPVVCRVAASQNFRHQFNTGIFCSPENWDKLRGMPLNNEQSISTRLSNISNDLYKIIALSDSVSPHQIIQEYKDAMSGKNRVWNLSALFADFDSKYKLTMRARAGIECAVNDFNSFKSIPDITRFTSEDVSLFFVSLVSKKISPYTAKKKVEQLKRLFAYASAMRYVAYSPFISFKMPQMPRLDPTRLTNEELILLHQKHLSIERLAYIRDIFLMQCYTGLAFGDIFRFTSENVTNNNGAEFITGERMKTGINYFLPFFPEAKQIAEKYNYTFRDLSNQKYNAYLKEVATICEIPKNLTTHVGRKTFAQKMIDSGFSAESVAKMMGHASFRMTQKHYGQISEARILNEYNRLKAAA